MGRFVKGTVREGQYPRITQEACSVSSITAIRSSDIIRGSGMRINT